MSYQKEFQQRFLPARNKMFRFALRLLGDVAEAEDVVQDVLMKVWNKREQMHEYRNAEAWCMQLTRNLSLDRLRRHGNKYRESLDGWDGAATGLTPDRSAEVSDEVLRLRQHLNELPETQKALVHLRDVEGYAYEEIASMLNLDMNQIRVYLHRARKALREKLLAQERYGLATNRSAG